MPRKLKSYHVRPDPDECEGFSIVAYTSTDAKKLAWKKHSLELYDWIDIRVNLQKWVDVSGLEEGHLIEEFDGLKRGCYSCIPEATCPICGELKIVQFDNGIIGCWECIDREGR